ncbi:MAG: glycosyltransferase family 4 protein [Jaaginema sp. PMC 1079.18]|nr:glycosyltransferase family 4 protein [Jaaginema sp. PMC 1080.18]MEC4850831.1 glycosyltransferase family 4 protein [Jaaginema sp. PMC 1079.18]MEC4868371.1 glycosyltransferase family 4 protein [Jaaginema sp. PMC 1078.18]
MKILLLNDLGTATGGAELQMLSLRQGLRDRAHDVRFLSSGAVPVANSEFLADYRCFGTNTLLQVFSQTANPSAYFTLRRALQEFQPDVVHIRMFLWQLSPLILPLLRNIPCVYQTAVYKAICPTGTKILPDGSPCQEPPGRACLKNGCLTPQTWAVLMLQQQLWQRWRGAIDLVVTLSHAMKNQLEIAGIEPIEVVHNGVPWRSPRPPLTSPPTVVFAGRFVPEKGIDVLLKAFARILNQIPEAQLLIAGQGVEAENLKALVAELAIAKSVRWLGHLERQQMEQHFDSAWVQVVPSLWAEPFGNVTTEAMMRGTAAIASAVGAQPEIVIDGETGYLVPPGDVESLTEALFKLLSDRERCEKMGQAGRERAIHHFSEDRRTEHFLMIYQRLKKQYKYHSDGFAI